MATIALYANQINQMPGRIKDVKKSVIDYKAELSALKAKTLTINKSVCDLEDVIRSIQTSTQTQEQKSTSLDTFNNNCEDFIAEVVRIDGDVADVIRQRKDDFYKKYSYLKPECEKNGWEKFKEGCRKAGQWCKDHWKAIATVAIIIAAVILVVAFPYAAPLLLLMAKGAILGAVIGGVAGGVISALGGNSFWEGFENGAFAGAIAGIIGGGMTGMYAMPAILAKTAVKLSLGETLFIGGATGAGTSLIGDIGDIFIKGENLSIGQVLFNMGVSGALGVLFAGIGYGIAKGFAALKVKLFSGKPNINSGPVKSGKKTNIINDMDEIAVNIENINKKYSDGYQMNNSIENILNSASYYDDPYEQVAAVTRSITDHAFANGNKRTAFDTLNMLLDDMGLSNSLTDTQKWNLIYDIAEGRLKDVTAISKILRGK